MFFSEEISATPVVLFQPSPLGEENEIVFQRLECMVRLQVHEVRVWVWMAGFLVEPTAVPTLWLSACSNCLVSE